jgi:alcohol dehydrogenase
MKRGARLVTCGSTSGISADTNLMMLFQRQLRLIGSFGCRMENMVSSMDKIAAGHVKPVIDTEIEFGDLDTALERMESRKVFGKIIMRMS